MTDGPDSLRRILEPSGCFWGHLERVPEGSRVPSVSLTYISVRQIWIYIFGTKYTCPIRHFPLSPGAQRVPWNPGTPLDPPLQSEQLWN